MNLFMKSHLLCLLSLVLNGLWVFPVSGDALRVTGRAKVVNGQAEVPRGLFGVHATQLTPERIADWGVESVRTISHGPGRPGNAPHGLSHVVECFWDRYQPALIVQHADWAERLRSVARTYGEASKELDRQPIVEFWNEPYLNWGVRPGVNYNGQYYRQEDREPGGRMTLHYADEPTEHLRWSELQVAVRTDNGQFDALASRYMPGDVQEGGTWTWRNREYRAETRPWAKDMTQESFWPGLQNVQWYNEMLKVFAPALKEANPEVILVVGWDFHIHQNGYRTWETVHRPTLDAAIEWADGYSEHHYGGNTLQVAASFEMATAYTVTTHGKALKFYNTEAGGDLDPERPGWAQPGYNTTPPEVRDRAAYTYMMRDVLHLIDKIPDKAEARAAHEAHHNRGVPAAFRMMRPLRGRLMEADSPRADVWVVSSLNAENQLVVAVFNDTRGRLQRPLKIDAPRGSSIQGVTFRKPGEDMEIEEVRVEAAGGSWETNVDLAVRESAVWVLDLEGTPDPEGVERHQFYAPEVLQGVPEGGHSVHTVEVPSMESTDASRAWLRLVHAGLNGGQARVTFNGHEVEIVPSAIGIYDVEVPFAQLREGENEVRVYREEGGGGIRMDAVSVILQP